MSKDFRFTPPPTSISTSSSHEEFAEIFDFAIQSPVFADDPSKTM